METKLEAFSLAAHDAETVMLVGDFTRWQENPINMIKGEGGVWTASVNLPPGTHPYLFLVDGQWRVDPESPLRMPNPYGGENSVRVVN